MDRQNKGIRPGRRKRLRLRVTAVLLVFMLFGTSCAPAPEMLTRTSALSMGEESFILQEASTASDSEKIGGGVKQIRTASPQAERKKSRTMIRPSTKKTAARVQTAQKVPAAVARAVQETAQT